MMSRKSKTYTQRAASFLVLLAVIFGSVVPSFAATQRRRVRRRTRVTRTTVPPVRYFTVAANQVIRVRMDTELNSGTARVWKLRMGSAMGFLILLLPRPVSGPFRPRRRWRGSSMPAAKYDGSLPGGQDRNRM